MKNIMESFCSTKGSLDYYKNFDLTFF